MPNRVRESLRRTLLGFVVSVVLVNCQPTEAPERGAERVAGWRADLEFLVTEAQRLHAGPTRPAHSAEFRRAATELAERVPALSDARVAVEIQGLLARLGDGHSLLYPAPTPRVAFAMLPIDLYRFADGLYVVNGTGPGADLIGHRVLGFGDRSTEEILRGMEPYVSRDNAMGLEAFAGLYLVQPAFLEAWGGASTLERVTLRVRDGAGQERAVTLEAGPARRTARRLFAPAPTPNQPNSPAPLYLQHPERVFWLQPMPEHRAVYCQINQIGDAPDQSLAAFTDQLRAAVTSDGVERVILDLRHNNGGNNQLLPPLLRTLGETTGAGSGRQLYVLTSRATFSAAQNLINRLERQIPGVLFAGEPSMSSPNFTGEDNPVRLPFSELVVSLSNRYWQDSSAEDRRPWIAPQLPVALTFADWSTNLDPVLAAVLAHSR